MKRRTKHLPIPRAAQDDPKAQELIRAWVAKNGLHCSLQTGLWHNQGADEPSAWGIVLADVTRHVANALGETNGRDVRETINAIREGFLIEIAHPTSGHPGKFVDY
jgi:hypothetical protein